MSHSILSTPGQLFGAQKITTARGILVQNSPLLSLSFSYSFSILLLIPQVISPNTPYSQSYPFQGLVWESGLKTMSLISECLTHQKMSIYQINSYIKVLKPNHIPVFL